MKITKKAAARISELMIERDHKKAMANVWETTEPKDDCDKRALWIYQCEAELSACEIEQTLLEDFGIELRDSFSSLNLWQEVALLERCIKTAKEAQRAQREAA